MHAATRRCLQAHQLFSYCTLANNDRGAVDGQGVFTSGLLSWGQLLAKVTWLLPFAARVVW